MQKKNQGFDTKNIVGIHQTKNTESFLVKQSNTVQYRSSFFIKTVREKKLVCADSVEGFAAALQSRDIIDSLSGASYAVTGPGL